MISASSLPRSELDVLKLPVSWVYPNTHLPLAAVDDVGVAHARWRDALLAGDAAGFETLLADDMNVHSPYGTVETKEQYLGTVRSGRLRYDPIRDEVPVTRAHGQAAIVTGRAVIAFQWDGQPALERLVYTAVYGWAAVHWRMLAWHSTLRADALG